MVFLDCYEHSQIEIDVQLGVTASRTCLIIADIIVLSLTWRSIYEHRRFFNRADQNNLSKTYSAVLLHDGMITLLDLPQHCFHTNPRDDLLYVRHKFNRL